MNKTVVYPGTFDPVTLGHVDLIERATQIFDRVIVAVAANTNKNPFFSLKERVELVRLALKKFSNVEVLDFSNLLIDFMQAQQVSIILRGVRAASDFDYETQLAATHKQLSPGIESIFMISAQNYTCISSSFVREIACLGGDIRPFVPEEVIAAFNKKLRK
jgi:pantetheine-phosphate adenylyltransferase